MALQIMKLAVEATSSMNTNPVVERYFYYTNRLLTGPNTLKIDTKCFFDSTGADVEALPALIASNSFFKVYVNGVLQMDDLLSYTPGPPGNGNLTIIIPEESDILPDSPVVLEISNFYPNANTTIYT